MTFPTSAAALAGALSEAVAARDTAALFKTGLAARLELVKTARAEAEALAASPLELLAIDRLTARLEEAAKVLANYCARLDEDCRAIDPSLAPLGAGQAVAPQT